MFLEDLELNFYSVTTHFFSTRARLTRWEWFASMAALGVCCVAFGMLAQALAGNRGAALFSLLFLWCTSCLSIRRLHDRGSSGIKLLLFFVPLIGWLWLLFTLLLAGTDGDNQYGPDPRLRGDYLRVQILRS